nr:hypothetical protein LSAT_5X16561 [Tanacetum cinerariifolium]
MGVRRGSLLCLHTRLPFFESSAGPPTTSLRPKGFIAQKRWDAGSRRGKPNEYSIEDESEVQQGHFCPPPFSRSRTWTLPLIQLPANKQLAFLYEEWKTRMNPVIQDILILELMLSSGEGVFIERGKSRVASLLTDFSKSKEDLSSDHLEHKGAALDVRSAAKERIKGPCSFSPCFDDALLARGATYRKKKRISLLL